MSQETIFPFMQRHIIQGDSRIVSDLAFSAFIPST
jgi:hypothetical protein